MQTSAVLWDGVPAGALEGAQGRLQAVERGAGGWGWHLKLIIINGVCLIILYSLEYGLF
jgi:hypothetical protein